MGGVVNSLVHGNFVYFGVEGTPGLWRTDGTVAGTILVAALPAGSWPLPWKSLNGSIYMALFDTNNKGFLWKSDGTAAGTQSLFDFNPTGAVGGLQRIIGSSGNRLLMVSTTGSPGFQLWTLDTSKVSGPGPDPDGSSNSQGNDGCTANTSAPVQAGMLALLGPAILASARRRKAGWSPTQF
jgi:ELWxxDGT repeat protein